MATNKWIHCPACDHRMFYLENGEEFRIEIKCSSCKRIIAVGSEGGDKYAYVKKDAVRPTAYTDVFPYTR